MRWAVCSQLSSGTIVFKMSLTIPQNFLCSSFSRTTILADWELKELGTCFTAASTICWIFESGMGLLGVS